MYYPLGCNRSAWTVTLPGHASTLSCPRAREVTLPTIRAEFGAELELALPLVWWLTSTCGVVVKVSSCGDAAPFWWFADYKPTNCTRSESRNMQFCCSIGGWLPHLTPSGSPINPCHLGTSLLGGLGSNYSAQLRKFAQPRMGGACNRVLSRRRGRPVVFISNKVQLEWGGPPVNSLPLDTLSALHSLLGGRAQLVYHRADLGPQQADEPDLRPAAHSAFASIFGKHSREERAWLKEHADIVSTRQAWNAAYGTHDTRAFNEFQLCIMAQSDAFVTTQGGPSRAALLFRKPTLIYHARGADNYENLRHFTGNSEVRVTSNSSGLLDRRWWDTHLTTPH